MTKFKEFSEEPLNKAHSIKIGFEFSCYVFKNRFAHGRQKFLLFRKAFSGVRGFTEE